MRRTRPAVLVLALSLGALVGTTVVAGATVVGSGTEVVDSVGSRPTSATSSPAPDAAPAPGTGSSPTPLAGVREVPPVVPPRPAVAPVSVSIPALDVTARIVPTGVMPDGAAEIPEDVDLVGWYRFGPGPTSAEGSTVLIGHRDGRGQGRGVLYDLARVDPGDRVQVTVAGGERVVYRIVSREVFDKEVVPLEELFSRTGPARLTLITCGGDYVAGEGGYQSNVVVTAVPLGAGT
jgi:LPXTG-site transpeptidase (sortase) family protein